MTFVITLRARETFWVLADRRLSYKNGPPKDDAVKLLDLQTVDAVAVLAYAGLGATLQGTQPSAWMSNVLRGRGGLTLEQSLAILANAATKQLPAWLQTISSDHIIRVLLTFPWVAGW